MIRFVLLCGRDHEFEGWFKSNAAFEEQVAASQVGCPACGDTAVRKAVMAPAVARAGERLPAAVDAAPVGPPSPREMLRKLREHVEKNFDHVGDRFAEEARRIHHGETERRDIWGRASLAEAKELHDEGITVRPLPEPPKLDG